MATPNGRRAGEFLSDGIVPSHGCDTKGPTVTLPSQQEELIARTEEAV